MACKKCCRISGKGNAEEDAHLLELWGMKRCVCAAVREAKHFLAELVAMVGTILFMMVL